MARSTFTNAPDFQVTIVNVPVTPDLQVSVTGTHQVFYDNSIALFRQGELSKPWKYSRAANIVQLHSIPEQSSLYSYHEETINAGM